MAKIRYNKDGWVCDRFPYDLTDYVGEMEVDEETLVNTLSSAPHFAWRVVNGNLVNERYEETPTEEINEERIKTLKELLVQSDYQAIKYAEGELTESEYLPIKQQRRLWRDEINRLQG